MNRPERIAAAIKHSKKLKKVIAEECGVTGSAVTQWVTGDSKSMKPENLFALAAATGVSAEWLANGTGSMVDDPGPEVPGAPSEKDYALIPQYTAKGSTGPGYLNDHVELREGLVFKREWLKKLGLKEQNLFVIYAEGTSMEPTIFDGEVLLIDHADTEPRNGKAYAIRRPGGELSVKRMVQSFAGDWIIRSDNQDKINYPDEQISPEAILQIEIFGRVVWRGGGM